MASLQTFPEGYVFAGKRRERIRQIGNAVPPRLATAFADSVVTATLGTDQRSA
jgi:DNA (cytosine-5)-methyltransferase 1